MKLPSLFFALALVFNCKVAFASTNLPAPVLLNYNLRTTVEAYEKVGHKDPKWDAEARKCLKAFANIRSSTNQLEEEVRALHKGLSALTEAKCDDPLIRYLYLKYVFVDSHPATDNGPAYWEVATALQKSDYPAIRKFYAVMRARSALQESEPRSADIATMLNKADSFLAAALDDESMPETEADQACELLTSAAWWAYQTHWDLYQKLEPVLSKRWQQSSFAHLTKGRAYISYAWAARGNGWASTVSKENWKLMSERLEVADKAFSQAWKLDSHDPRICSEMVRLELGQGKGRDRMELWFQRGMKLNPGNYNLCFEKLNYLRPRWFGSHEEMIKFGRECATNTDWSGLVPMMLADTHYEVFKELSRDEQAGYWKRPEVWADIQLSFDRLFKVSPKENSHRQNYSYYAYWAEKWQVFADQTKLFPETNYTYFGGVEQYNLMVKTADEHLKKK